MTFEAETFRRRFYSFVRKPKDCQTCFLLNEYLFMKSQRRYIRIRQTRSVHETNRNGFEEDEIIFLTSETNGEWYAGRRLSGEAVAVHEDDICELDLPDTRPNELYLVASVAEYDSKERTDISFSKNTVIVVSREIDDYWLEGTVIGDNGKRLGCAGLFPKSFVVKLVETKSETIDERAEGIGKELVSRSDHGTANADDAGTAKVELCRDQLLNQEGPFTVYDDPPGSTGDSTPVIENFQPPGIEAGQTRPMPFAKSLFPFRGENSKELSFDANREITIRRYINHEWIEGELDGNIGIFPASFVQVMVDLPNTMLLSADRFRTETAQSDAVGIASVLFDFVGRESDELTVCAGESLSVLEMVNADWAHCYDPGRNRTGIIPVSFLKIFMDDEDEATSPDESSDSDSSHGLSAPGEGILPPAAAGVHENCHKDNTDVLMRSFSVAGWNNSRTYSRDSCISSKDLDDFFGISSTDVPISCHSEWSAVESKSRKPPARPPPPKFAPGSRKFLSDNPLLQKNIPPPRPAVLPHRATVASLSLTDYNFGQAKLFMSSSPIHSTLKSENIETNKRRIIEDLVTTELQYLSDIGIWEAEIKQCAQITSEQKRILTNGIPQLKALSRSLVALLAEQQHRPLELQCYGYVFMQLRDDFMKTFGYHFRCVEAMSGIIEGKDPVLQEALNICLSEMKALGSNVFDVPTAVSRPIQRCLKYPLFIGELLKNTPISHVDHPKLLEALKQMSSLASKMNESKRRRELAVKYRSASTESFSKRLSKLNMHSVKKKSNRFKYRVSTQMGLTQMQRDATFDTLVQSLDISERRVCKFLHALQIYKQSVTAQARRYTDTYVANDKLALSTDKLRTVVRTYCRNLLEETSSLSRYLDETIGAEAKKFLRLPVTKMIQKRYDKLIDFVSAKKDNKNPEDVRLKQCDYEALNNQLKSTLPKLIETIRTRTIALVQSVIAKDSEYFDRMDTLRDELSEEARRYLAIPYRRFADCYERRLRIFLLVGKLANGGVPLSSESLGSVAEPSVLADYGTRQDQVRAQDEREREALIRIMCGQGQESVLMSVKERWPPNGSDVIGSKTNQLCVERGDVVIVLKEAGLDPWLCDNGVYKGYLPGSCLTPFKRGFVQNAEQDTTHSASLPVQPQRPQPVIPTTSSNEVKDFAVKGSNLIDLDENLLDLSSPPRSGCHAPVHSTSPTPPLSTTRSLTTSSVTALSPTNPFSAEAFFNSRVETRIEPVHVSTAHPLAVRNEPANTVDSLLDDLLSSTKEVPSNSGRPTSPLVAPLIPIRPYEPIIESLAKNSGNRSGAVNESPLNEVASVAACEQKEPLIPNHGSSHLPLLSQREADRFYEQPPLSHESSSNKIGSALKTEGIVPVRAAPPPPPPRGTDEYSGTRVSHTNSAEHVLESFTVEFAFDGTDDIQVSVEEGEEVLVLKKCDDDGNDEWWMVRKKCGSVGFMPASYLKHNK